MKYGVICAKNAKNIGDDIQTYSAMKLLPKVDYFIERESTCDFVSKNKEPVAVIMNAWWFWKKWMWPPSKYIIPKLTSIHFSEWTSNNWGSSLEFEMLEGIGKDYLNSWGPVGARDIDTLNMLRSKKIKSYFSGCLTLTLPEMKKKKSKNRYICLVDVSEEIINYVKNIIKETNIKIEIMHHDILKDNDTLSWNDRMKNVEKLLEKYNNSFLVITSRLHVVLPCLSLKVPTLLVRDDPDNRRFKPYIELCNYMKTDDFLNGNYDILNPLKNKKDYLKIRNSLIDEINSFIDETKKFDLNPLDEMVKTSYTEEEKRDWQFNLMRDALDKWFYQSREMLSEYNKTIDYLRKVEKELDDLKSSTSWKITKPIRKAKEIINNAKK